MNHEDLYQQALGALERLFSDTSVGVEKTLQSFQELNDWIDMNIEALKEDVHLKEE